MQRGQYVILNYLRQGPVLSFISCARLLRAILARALGLLSISVSRATIIRAFLPNAGAFARTAFRAPSPCPASGLFNRSSGFSHFMIHPIRRLSAVSGILIGSVLYNYPVHADNDTIRPQRVLSVVTADWNKDGSFDRAVLIESETEPDQADLLVYLSDASNPMQLAIDKKNIAWYGTLWGTQPTLAVTERGSLVITAANEATGRNRWTQKLTVAYRDNSFVVVGYTDTERDTLEPGSSLSCDVNLLSGGGVKNGKPFKTLAKAVALTDWSEASIPPECR